MPADGIAQTLRRLALEKLYLTLPRLNCQRTCQDACGPILFQGEEGNRIAARVGGRPRAIDAARCPLLTRDGRCTVYDIRPMICRLWGLTRAMACPWGCVPERWLGEDEARALLAQAEAE